MGLLNEGLNSKAVQKTGRAKKLTLGGRTDEYPVYRIRLDQLFYNDQNDRIATWISEYRSDNDGRMPDISDRENYNNLIEDLIVKSNPEALDKTRKNIKLVGQREDGVVLNDGRVIDGNRRFTCLRKLAREEDRFNYFEAVILEDSLESNAKEIKKMELMLQHGIDEKVDYTPIDRLVGIYGDIVEKRMFTAEEYAKYTNETLPEVTRRLDVASLMVEFLEFINAPKKYHIARDLQIYYPLEELAKLIPKCHNTDEAEDLKITVFNTILMNTGGDTTRYVRDFKKIMGTKYQEKFLEEQKELAAEVIDKLAENGSTNVEHIRDNLRADNEIVSKMKDSVDRAMFKVKSRETLTQPVNMINKATDLVDGINLDIVNQKLEPADKKLFAQKLDLLIEKLNEIRENI